MRSNSYEKNSYELWVVRNISAILKDISGNWDGGRILEVYIRYIYLQFPNYLKIAPAIDVLGTKVKLSA